MMHECPLCELETDVYGIYPSGYVVPKSDQRSIEFKNAALRRRSGPYYRIVNLSSIEGRSPHSSAKIASTIEDSASHFLDKIDWLPKELIVVINPRLTRAMGRSLFPRSTMEGTVIDINPRLLLEFDIESFRRVMLHEFSHHMRFHQGQRPTTPAAAHDDLFCDILAKVDPRSAANGRKSCRYFTDDVDPSVLMKRLGDADSVRFNVVVYQGKYKVKLTSEQDKGQVPWDTLRLSTLQSIAQMYPGKLSRIRVVSNGTVRATNMLSFLDDFVRMNGTLPSSKKIAQIISNELGVHGRSTVSRGSNPAPGSRRTSAPERSRTKKRSAKKAAAKKSPKKAAKKAPKRAAKKSPAKKAPSKKSRSSRSKRRH